MKLSITHTVEKWFTVIRVDVDIVVYVLAFLEESLISIGHVFLEYPIPSRDIRRKLRRVVLAEHSRPQAKRKYMKLIKSLQPTLYI